MSGYVVTRRSPTGEPLEIKCKAHEGCTWGMVVAGKRSDDDPILRAQFENHLREAKTPDVAAFGHLRRRRM
ncbi:MAG: hypothetical protein QOD77_1242 [Thermoplasmata archaeon]|jgi:hypothetical protein|nr:hypothetical protein [Thermoplasmata archaeon]